MTYKFTDSTNLVVSDNKGWSGLASNPEILQWIAEGNTPDVADPVAITISPISPRQIRQALTRAGLREVVEEAVASGNQDLKDWYEFATEFDRYNQHVLNMGNTLGKTPEELDALWLLGASL